MCDLSIVLVVRIKILCNTNLPALHNSVALVRLPVGNRRARKPNKLVAAATQLPRPTALRREVSRRQPKDAVAHLTCLHPDGL